MFYFLLFIFLFLLGIGVLRMLLESHSQEDRSLDNRVERRKHEFFYLFGPHSDHEINHLKKENDKDEDVSSIHGVTAAGFDVGDEDVLEDDFYDDEDEPDDLKEYDDLYMDGLTQEEIDYDYCQSQEEDSE